MNITPERKKAFWFFVIALAAVYYTPAIISRRNPSTHSVLTMAPAPPVPFRGLIGQFAARQPIAGRGLCNLRLEIRDDKPGTFVAYSTVTCTNPYVWRPRTYLYVAARPTSAILHGVAEDGAIRFDAVDTVSGPCAPTSYTVKPFGVNQIIAQWKDKCDGGSMLLGRVGR